MNATGLALRIPHILSSILGYVDSDDGDSWIYQASYRKGYLFRCILVNRLWYSEAIPHLWSNIVGDLMSGHTLPALLANIEPGRRNFYTNYVEAASLAPVDQNKAHENDGALDGVAFPRLQFVMLICYGWTSHVPRLDGATVKVLDIHPRFEYYPETYCVGLDDWEEILKAIPDIFPNLEEVTFYDKAMVYSGEMERFAKRLPLLTSFDHTSVVEC